MYTLVQDFLGEKNKAEVILCFHYLICMLLPVLKEIKQEYIDINKAVAKFPRKPM